MDRARKQATDRPRLLIDALAYSPDDGGFTKAIRDLLDACASLEEFDVVVATHRAHTQELARPGLRVIGLRFPLRLRFFASLVILPWLTRRFRVDAVHCDISALPAFLGVPGSVTVHDLYFLRERDAGLSLGRRVMQGYWQHLFVASLRRARVIKAISRATADDIATYVAPDLPVQVVWPKVPLADSKPRTWPKAGEPLRILAVGSVVPRRNLPFLIRALTRVKSPWRLDIAGALWWGAADLVTVAQDSRVKVHGFVSGAALDALYAEAHVLISPSRYEGFGAPVAEAMAQGLPVLTSDTGAFRDYVPQDCRFALDDPAALAALIDALGPKAWAERRSECLQAVRRFSVEAQIAGHRRLFVQLTTPDSPVIHHRASGRQADVRTSMLGRVRAYLRRVARTVAGSTGERALHRFYHRTLRMTGRFGVPETPRTQQLLAALVGHSNTILDVGANVGRYSQFLLTHARPNSRGWAFEPNPEAADLLDANVPKGRMRVLRVAIGARDTTGWLHVPTDDLGNAVTAIGWAGDGVPGMTTDAQVPIRSLDSLISDGTVRIEPPVFLKIDVEGEERAVLQGASDLLRTSRPLIYMECQRTHLDRAGVSATEVWDILQDAGYRILGLVADRLVACAAIRDDVPNYVVIPNEWAPEQLNVEALARQVPLVHQR
jgi:FkbM family methyltransferase